MEHSLALVTLSVFFTRARDELIVRGASVESNPAIQHLLGTTSAAFLVMEGSPQRIATAQELGLPFEPASVPPCVAPSTGILFLLRPTVLSETGLFGSLRLISRGNILLRDTQQSLPPRAGIKRAFIQSSRKRTNSDQQSLFLDLPLFSLSIYIYLLLPLHSDTVRGPQGTTLLRKGKV